MRGRVLCSLAGIAFLASVSAHASQTRSTDTLAHMFTQAGNFGPPPYAADPFTCNAATIRTTYYNTTANTIKLCNGSVWQTLGLAGGAAGGITSGNADAGCTPSTLIYNDGAGNIGCGPTATATGTTRIGLPAGGVANPVIGPSGGATTGIWFRSGSAISFSQGGNNNFEINNALVEMGSNGQLVWTAVSNDAGQFQDTTLYRVGAGVVSLGTTSANGLGWFQNGGEASLAGNYTNATASLTATNLSFTVISGKHYNFDAYLQLTESTAADGVAIAFDGGSAAATDFIVTCVLTNATGTTVTQANAIATALATVINATTTVVTTQQMYECHGMFTPSGNGTFILRARQDTHSTGTLTLLKGSSLILRDTKVL